MAGSHRQDQEAPSITKELRSCSQFSPGVFVPCGGCSSRAAVQEEEQGCSGVCWSHNSAAIRELGKQGVAAALGSALSPASGKRLLLVRRN